MDDRQNMMENGGQQENTENMENTESTENAESRMKENPAQGLPAGTGKRKADTEAVLSAAFSRRFYWWPCWLAEFPWAEASL